MLDTLPQAPNTEVDREAIRQIGGGRKIVVLDDDPTGTQTIHDVDVLTEWSVPSLVSALVDPAWCVFVLTNSRALPEARAVAVAEEVMANLTEASRRAGREFTLVSRSDSTLRGHFPAEIDAVLRSASFPVDAVCVIPAFLEAGRYTIEGGHYVAEQGRLIAVAETEFSRDTTFGYRSSYLPNWIEEKTGGRVKSRDVVKITLAMLRNQGAAGVSTTLVESPPGSWVVVDAIDRADLEIFTHGMLLAERTGRRYVFRTAASFVQVRSAIVPRPVLDARELVRPERRAGIVVLGSYVAKSTRQLVLAAAAPRVCPIEFRVAELVDAESGRSEIARTAEAIQQVLQAGQHALVYTTRDPATRLGRAGDLAASGRISDALVAMIGRVTAEPRFFIAKGGITSSEIAVRALGVRKARVIGQAAQGIPVWRLGAETRFPGMAYVIFPGNVGQDDSLARLIESLSV